MKNESGITPMKYNVLILPKKVERISKGGIILTDETLDREKYAQEEGIIIEIGSIAFTDPDWKVKPQVGENILFTRHSGKLVKGNDGSDYRLITDDEIIAVMK